MISERRLDDEIKFRVEHSSFGQRQENYGRVEGARQPTMKGVYAGILLFYVLYFFRPEDFIPGLSALPLEKIAFILTGLALLGAIVFEHVRSNTEIHLLMGLLAYLCLCIPTSVWRGGSFNVVILGFSKVLLPVIITMWVLTTMQRLKSVILVQIFAMLTMALFALSHSRQGERMFGVGNMFSDPNDFALNLCVILPFCVALLLSSRTRPRKLFWAAAVGVTLLAIVATYSRGGFLALIAVLLLIWRRFSIRTQTALGLLVAMGLLATVAVFVVGKSSYFDRMSTIIHPQDDKNGTAEIREQLLRTSVQLTLRHPLLGVGPGQFPIASGYWHESHNAYTQLSSEGGLPSLLIFLVLIRRAFHNLRMLRGTQKASETWYLVQALYCAMGGYLVGTFFLSTAYYLLPYLLVAYSVALLQISKVNAQKEELFQGKVASLTWYDETALRP
jgi:O-antigen ligase